MPSTITVLIASVLPQPMSTAITMAPSPPRAPRRASAASELAGRPQDLAGQFTRLLQTHPVARERLAVGMRRDLPVEHVVDELGHAVAAQVAVDARRP